ncbi:S-adenosyl-L-methionine-dependent methyltransferase [Lipomyces japonicus]|uniref:S-adenosyl-L-methionine-dependent methyltransferase n=1 Tax=Lipomyces japonicus TaxID=56871 RepID=UPI0034CEDA8F
MTSVAKEQDNWSAKQYTQTAAFVPVLTSKVVSLVDLKPDDVILDLGAGDGILSIAIASKVKTVHATDSSRSMVEYTQQRINDAGDAARNLTTAVVDARFIGQAGLPRGVYNKVFSNAALHWILRDQATRTQVFKDVYDLLPTGGQFVAEFGGHGNVAEIYTAISSAVRRQWAKKGGIDGQEVTHEYIRDNLSPWFFSDKETTLKYLTDAGFRVQHLELEYRPTELPQGDDGARGWLDTFGFSFWKGLTGDEKEQVIQEVIEALRFSAFVESRGVWVVGYVRLRFKAIKD